MNRSKFGYDVDSFDVVSEVPNLRVIVIALSYGQDVPWHYHTNITDSFFCLEGPVVIEYGTRGESVKLNSGDRYEIPPGTPHRTSGVDRGPCKFLIVQGIGEYDFIPTAR